MRQGIPQSVDILDQRGEDRGQGEGKELKVSVEGERRASHGSRWTKGSAR